MRARARISPADLLAYSERAAVVLEELGMPRMAGRVVGWLLVCDPPHQSLTELAEVLQASKASVSTSTRLLVQLGIAERTSFPGDRRDYVRLKPDAWSEMLSAYEREVQKVLAIADEGLSILAGAPPERRRRLMELRSLYAFLQRIGPDVMKAWRRELAARRRS